MPAQGLMIQGTGSSVGKSLLVTALCRILKQDGYRVAPFKAQNMSLNSYITPEGLEIARAQVVQAEAAGLVPSALMNPILLKPITDIGAQVIIKGRVYGNMSAAEYHDFKPRLKEIVHQAYAELARHYDFIVLEGAGSPAEINLREHDLVNMGMAELADVPVLLAADIDRGGVFASIAGTMLLLAEEEKERVKGVIINKFRGDKDILQPGIRMLEEIIKRPVIGVIPYLQVEIDEEDNVMEEFRHQNAGFSADIVVAVPVLPHISNFTDFRVLRGFYDVDLRYVKPGEKIGNPDVVIIPGSKNTLEDLQYLLDNGWGQEIKALAGRGKLVIGICGGLQMLGREVSDPLGAESHLRRMQGLGLLEVTTEFQKEKVTTQVRGWLREEAACAGVNLLWTNRNGSARGCSDQGGKNLGNNYLQGLAGEEVEGYEIHLGVSTLGPEARPFLNLEKEAGDTVDGAVNREGNVWGTYLHGIFDNTAFTRKLLNNVRLRKGLAPLAEIPPHPRELKEREYDRLAAYVREHLDLAWIYRLLEGRSEAHGK